MAFVGSKPSAKHIAIREDLDPFNNRLSNLRWGTRKESKAVQATSKRLVEARLERPGSLAPHINDIRDSLSKGETVKSIARRYNKTHSLISRIKNERSYRNNG
jgi:hypothetical protein